MTGVGGRQSPDRPIKSGGGPGQAAVGREAALAAFLAEAAAQPFEPGQWDCLMTVANWVKACTGRDPAARLRGRYRTMAGAARIVERAGGPLALVAGLARESGIRRQESRRFDLRPGDIGLVRIPGHGCFGAVRGFGRWVVKLDRGLVAMHFPTIAAWRIV